MSVFASFALAVALILVDQLVKYWALTCLSPVGSISVIDGLLRLTYVENYGAAFGILQGQRWLLIVVTLAILAAACWLIASGRIRGTVERLCVSLIVAGGAGNLIDRILRGFVVDYIDINELFSYPMFNLADCCVVIGAVLMVGNVLLSERKAPKQLEKNHEPTE